MYQKGFTLVELLIYVAVLMMLVGATIPFLLNMSSLRAKHFAQADLYSQMRFVTERIKHDIRRASIAGVGASVSYVDLATTSNVYSLMRSDYYGSLNPNNLVTFSVSNGILQETYEGFTYNLTGPDVTVTSLIFYNNFDYATYKSYNVGFKITMVVNAGSAKSNLIHTMTVNSSALTRNNITN